MIDLLGRTTPSPIFLQRINKKNSSGLARILSNDVSLGEVLHPDQNFPISSSEHFYQSTKEWEEQNNAQCFAIMSDGVAVGMISLSHIDKLNMSANIGYWIASSEWGKGIGTQAFNQMLDYARRLKLRKVSATIAKENLASIKIWQRHGAKISASGNSKLRIELALD